MINVASRSLQEGAVAGPDPWKAQHARVVHRVAAAGQQLRRRAARPLGRADQGHPPRDRAVDGPTRAAPRSRRPHRPCTRRARCPSVPPLPRSPRPHARSTAARAASVCRPRRADQAEGPVAAAADDGHDDVRRRRPVARPRPRDRASAATCRPAAPARSTTGTTATSTPRWRARPTGRCPSGRIAPARGAVCSASRWPRCRSLLLAAVVNSLAAVAGAGGVPRATRSSTRIWLKRRTPQNIVIGGAAGAVPPLVGWAAVTGEHHRHVDLPVRDRLLLDAAALLGAVAAHEGRVRRRSACRCCPSSRRARDAPPDPAVHASCSTA